MKAPALLLFTIFGILAFSVPLRAATGSTLQIEVAAVRLRFFGESNKLYQLQFSTQLQGWTNLIQVIGNGVITNIIDWTDGERKFYRLIEFADLAALNKGLIAHYPFDGDATDTSTNHNDATVLGPTLTTDRFGRQGSAYSFNGTNSLLEAPDRNYLELASSDFTISFWASRSSSQPYSVILGKDAFDTTQSKWVVLLGRYHYPSTPTLTFHFQELNNGALHWFGSVPIIDDFEIWHHYAISRLGTTYSIFQDGVLLESLNDSGPLPSPNPATLTIGNAENAHWHKGMIDEIRIYNRALNAAELQTLFVLKQ